MVYIDLPHITIMEQIQQFDQNQEPISLERSIGSLFADWLEEKNRVSDFDRLSENVIVSIDGEVARISGKGFPAKVSEIMKMVVKPTQEIKFLPRVAGG
jgi:hypothetical protein